MSLITRCPACSALSRVEPTQFGAAGAWVYCSQCQKVFDAAAHEVSAQEATSTIVSLAGSAQGPGLSVMEQGHIRVEELTFTQEGLAASFWHRPVVRSVLVTAVVLMGLALTLQVLVQERERLAAQFPSWRPALREICKPLGCRIVRLRQIESIVIDGASLNKVSTGIYRLSFSLRNTALVPLALPALELTLTDVYDRAIIRRVVPPSELQAEALGLEASSEMNISMTLHVTSQEEADRLSSYRILAFYP